jgi:hypothetical protein
MKDGRRRIGKRNRIRVLDKVWVWDLIWSRKGRKVGGVIRKGREGGKVGKGRMGFKELGD